MKTGNAISLKDKALSKAQRSVKRKDAIPLTIKHYVGDIWTDEELIGLGDALIDYMENKDTKPMPLLKSFLTSHRISNNTIGKLRKRSEYFAECYKLAEDIQEEKLLIHGLENQPTFAIFLLKTKFAYRENEPEKGFSRARIQFIGFDDDDESITLKPKRIAECDNDINNKDTEVTT